MLLAAAAIASQPAAAGVILDSGAGTACCFYYGISADLPATPNKGPNAMAVQFTLSSWTAITSIETYADVAKAGVLTNRVYSASSGFPGSSSPLFEASIFVPATEILDPDHWVWEDVFAPIGATGLSWTLAPGAYWATFEALGSSTLQAAPSSNVWFAAPYLVKSGVFGSDWIDAGSYYLSARIKGDAVSALAVPEPATWALMAAAFGLVGLAVRRTRGGAQAAPIGAALRSAAMRTAVLSGLTLGAAAPAAASITVIEAMGITEDNPFYTYPERTPFTLTFNYDTSLPNVFSDPVDGIWLGLASSTLVIGADTFSFNTLSWNQTVLGLGFLSIVGWNDFDLSFAWSLDLEVRPVSVSRPMKAEDFINSRSWFSLQGQKKPWHTMRG